MIDVRYGNVFQIEGRCDLFPAGASRAVQQQPEKVRERRWRRQHVALGRFLKCGFEKPDGEFVVCFYDRPIRAGFWNLSRLLR